MNNLTILAINIFVILAAALISVSMAAAPRTTWGEHKDGEVKLHSTTVKFPAGEKQTTAIYQPDKLHAACQISHISLKAIKNEQGLSSATIVAGGPDDNNVKIQLTRTVGNTKDMEFTLLVLGIANMECDCPIL